MTVEQKNEMLRTKFWRALYSTDLQNATRVYYHQIKEFELLRRKVRGEEYELYTHKKMTEKESITKNPEKTTEVKTSVQHQPLNLRDNSSDKAIKELSKRLESIEKILKYRNYSRFNQRPRSTQRNTNLKQEEQKQEDLKPTKAPEKSKNISPNVKPALNQ